MIYISPSILASDFVILGEQVAEAQAGGADMIHVDVMDGVFVPNISIGFPVIKSLSSHFSIPLDVHLMIDDPDRYVDLACTSGADFLTVHIERLRDPKSTLERIREHGVHPSISVSPKTPIESVFPYIRDADMILVMTVEPGFGGQHIIPETLIKVRKLRDEVNRRGLRNYKIEVDGGIRASNVATAVTAGANVIVTGSAVFGDPDIPAAIKSIRSAANGDV